MMFLDYRCGFNGRIIIHFQSNNAEISQGIIKNECYLLFEEVPLLQGECIRLSDDRDNVDHLTETSHEFYIQRSQTERERDNMRKQGR